MVKKDPPTVEEFEKMVKEDKELLDITLQVISKIDYPISKRPKPEQKPTFCLLNLGQKYFDGGAPMAQPMVYIDGSLVPYSVERTFKDEKEAKEYSKKYGIKIV